MSNWRNMLIAQASGMVEEISPLTFTALEAGSFVTLTAENPSDTLMYRTSNTDSWIKYNIDKSIALVNAGDYVQFKNTREGVSYYESNARFTMQGKISASGNIQSLQNWSNACAAQCYCNIFQGCTALTSAPELPATTLSFGCYSSMFRGCTALTSAPELPATELAGSCYGNMFRECTALTSAPELPATKLAGSCYYKMFQGCTALTSAPELPATELIYNCYGNMFQECANLTYIKVGFAEWVNNATSSWVDGVSSTGNFVCPKSLPVEYGNSSIPTGWIVSNTD